MTERGSILRQTDAGWLISKASDDNESEWHLIHGPVSVPSEFDALALAVAKFVADNRLGDNVFLTLDSKSALPAKFSVSNLRELRDRKALSYRVEELLPLAAEDFEVDFISEDTDVLGIATPTQNFYPLLESMEDHGLHVQSISPTALLAAQSYLGDDKHQVCDLLVWHDEDHLEVFQTTRRRVLNWWNLPANVSSLQQLIASIAVRRAGPDNPPLVVGLVDANSEFASSLAELPDLATKRVETHSLAIHARKLASKVMSGRATPWCELRRGRFVTGDRYRELRGEIQWFQWALACLLIVTAFFFWMRSRKFNEMTATTTQDQQALYRELFPNSRVPSAIVSRLKSEKAKLSGARGRDAAIEQPPSALNVLYELLSALPEELRIQFQQLRIDDGKLYLDVKTRKVGDASELADALEKQGFSIEPPTTEQFDAKQVSVRINGRTTVGQLTTQLKKSQSSSSADES